MNKVHFLLLSMIAIYPIVSTGCHTPAECYQQAINDLTVQRELLLKEKAEVLHKIDELQKKVNADIERINSEKETSLVNVNGRVEDCKNTLTHIDKLLALGKDRISNAIPSLLEGKKNEYFGSCNNGYSCIKSDESVSLRSVLGNGYLSNRNGRICQGGSSACADYVGIQGARNFYKIIK